MLSKNINFKNFKKNNKNFKKKKFIKLLKDKKLTDYYPLIESLLPSYKYSYSKTELKKYKKYKFINIIGMGGSILGAEAIHDFCIKKVKKKINFFNNMQTKNTLKYMSKSLNIIISKSGNTLETITNSNLLLSKNNNLIITEKKDSFLTQLAYQMKSEVIEHKNYIGGRYSVLSEVGMLPAELMGLSEKKFKRFNYLIKNKKFVYNLIENVFSIYFLYKQGKKNSVILNFDEQTENLFKWYQQLTAESLGKNGKGILPLVCSMPKDNHSLTQLFLDGPKNCFFTFFGAKETLSQKLYNNKLFGKFDFLKNKSISQILNSQRIATENIFKKKKIPFRTFEINNRNEQTIGELFTFFILETILLGKLMKINPFDQPAVESIKAETVKILI